MENQDTQIVEEQTTQIEEKTTEVVETNDVPFKVFKTQEEFDNHAGYIKKSTTSSILKELGLDDKSQLDELKSSVKKTLATNEELSTYREQTEEQVKDLRLDNQLLMKGVPADNLDYAKLDILKSEIDIADEQALSDFLNNSKWINSEQSQQKEVINTTPKGLENLSDSESFRLKQFLG